MLDQNILIILLYTIIVITVIHYWYGQFNMIEGLDATIQQQSYEALNNLSSMYNGGKLIVTDLQVTGTATINQIASNAGNPTKIDKLNVSERITIQSNEQVPLIIQNTKTNDRTNWIQFKNSTGAVEQQIGVDGNGYMALQKYSTPRYIKHQPFYTKYYYKALGDGEDISGYNPLRGIPSVDECAEKCMAVPDARGALWINNKDCFCKKRVDLKGGIYGDRHSVLFQNSRNITHTI